MLKPIILELLKTLFVVFAISNVVILVRRNYSELDFTFKVWREFTWMMAVKSLVVLTTTITVFCLLVIYSPILRWGWLSNIFEGGGNAAISPIAETGANSSYLIMKIIVIVFFAALIFVMPFIARAEENMFRKGYSSWKDISTQAIKFGGVHFFMGVPFGAMIALIIPGFFFGMKYRAAYMSAKERYAGNEEGEKMAQEEAVFCSTVWHSLYNTTALAGFFILSVIELFFFS